MTYKSIEKDKNNWIILKFSIPLRMYISRFKGKLTAMHRYVSNGQNRFFNVANRDFWRNIIGGYYRTYFGVNHIHFIYMLNIDASKQRRITSELTVRIRKIINCKVEVLPFENMDEVDRLLLSSKSGMSNYKKIKIQEFCESDE
jgi:hypothetical protein